MILFSGTSNRPLAQAVAQSLGVTLGDVEITRFIDNECRVYVVDDVRGKDVFVLQSLSAVADQQLVELCLLGQALKDGGANKVTAVIPWMGYSKQDKAFRPGEAVSAQLIAKFIEAAGFDAVITVELHSETLLPYFHIPVTELSTRTLLSDALPRGIDKTQLVVVSPDTGGKSRSEKFAAAMSLPIIYLDKARNPVTGEVAVVGISADLHKRHVIIFDDIINSGATAAKTSHFLKAQGANHIYFLATHAVLAGHAPQLLQKSVIDIIVVTDTIWIPEAKQFPKLSSVSVAPQLADAIKNAVR